MDSMQVLYSSERPVSFLSWLELQERVSTDINVNFKQYQDYIIGWFKQAKTKSNISEDYFSDMYVDLMRELTLNFATEEEKRFIANFDYNKKENFDIIIPFFVSKLKSICLYYSNRREALKGKISMLPYKGTNTSVIKAVRDIIIKHAYRGDAQKIVEGVTTVPSLTSINQFLDISVEELYDDTDYFETGINTKKETNRIDSDLYKNFSNSIVKAIQQYPVFIESLKYNLSVNLAFSGTELENLKERDFINYLKSNNNDDLKLNLIKQIAPKYLNTDFYYLSVGNTKNDFVSGVLFEAVDYNGERIQNPLNTSKSTVATVQSLDKLYTAYEVGRFFVPSKIGALLYNAPKKSFHINFNKLTPNSVYVFPNPSIIEGDQEDYPLLYKVVLDWSKIGSSGGFCFGDVLTEKNYHRFYGYESLSQDILAQPYGLSLSVDDTDFWSGDYSENWTQSDLWPGVDEVERLHKVQRTEALLINAGTAVDWYSDIFGNEFSLYKNVTDENNLVSNKKVNLPGNLYVKNTTSGLVSSFEHHFRSLVRKYPEEVGNEIAKEIYSVFVIKNIIVLETKNYVTIDSYDFNYNDKKFINTLLPGLYIPKHSIDSYLEKFINSFYVEKTGDLFLCFLKLVPQLSASNYKSLYPFIYKMNIDKLDLEQIYPAPGVDITSTYSLSSGKYKTFAEVDLRFVEGGKFSYNQKLNAFNLTYQAYNLNNIPFIINEQFSLNNETNKLFSFTPTLHKPFLYINDTNYSNSINDPSLRYSATYSENAGVKTEGVFEWTLDKRDCDNYYFCSTINPVFINVPGSHFIQFDWDQYIYGNVFIGCENFGVTKIDLENIIDFRDGSPVIRIIEEDEWYRVADYNFNNLVYTLSAKRPFKTKNTLIEFFISSQQTLSGVVFCTDLLSTYKFVKIVKLGNGEGRVFTRPYCMECGDTCEFLFPVGGSITLTPSAAEDSFFAGWRGLECEGLAGSCNLVVTDNTTLTAVFNTTPTFTLTVASNLTGSNIITKDGLINYPLTASAIYKQYEFAVLSANDIFGYVFRGFTNSGCSENNPCGVTMVKDIILTATYLKTDFNLTINNVQQNNEVGQGVLYCSIDPNTPITTQTTFSAIPANTFITISAVPADKTYQFLTFKGTPCEGRSVDNCSFNLTKTSSISGYFSRPILNIGVETYGTGVFYIESDTKKIDYGTYNLRNSKNKSTTTYVSGSFVYLSAFGVGETGIVSLCAGKLNNYSIQPDGDQLLTFSFMATESLTISAVGLVDSSTITVTKSGNSTLSAYNIVQVRNVKTVHEISRDNSSLTIVGSIDDYMTIIPLNETSLTRVLYVIGSDYLVYLMSCDANNPIYVTDNTNSTVNQFKINAKELLVSYDNNLPLIINGFEGAPYYSDFNDIITVDNSGAEVYNTITIAPLTATVVYQSTL